MAVKNHKTTHGAFLIVNIFFNSLGLKKLRHTFLRSLWSRRCWQLCL